MKKLFSLIALLAILLIAGQAAAEMYSVNLATGLAEYDIDGTKRVTASLHGTKTDPFSNTILGGVLEPSTSLDIDEFYCLLNLSNTGSASSEYVTAYFDNWNYWQLRCYEHYGFDDWDLGSYYRIYLFDVTPD